VRMRNLLRLIPAGLLGAGAAVLISCGSSGKGLIPLANAGPLQGDFQAILRAAQEGNGNCAATEAQIRKTERDLAALPSTVDGGLRGRIAEGVTNLSARARALCAQPLAQTTTTTETTTTTSPPATTTGTQPTATTTTPTATTPGTGTPSEEGGTQAPGEGGAEEGRGEEAEGNGGQGHGNGLGHGDGGGRGNGAGGAAPEETGAGEANGGTGGGK
jgi:hypothetical protein